MHVRPHVAQNTTCRASGTDAQTARHAVLCDQAEEAEAGGGDLCLNENSRVDAQGKVSGSRASELDVYLRSCFSMLYWLILITYQLAADGPDSRCSQQYRCQALRDNPFLIFYAQQASSS